MGAFLGFKARRFTSTAGANDRGGGGTQEHAPLTLDKATEASWTITGQDGRLQIRSPIDRFVCHWRAGFRTEARI